MSTSRKDKVLVGEIVRPHGVRGEIKVKNLTDSIDFFEKLKTFYIEDKEFVLERVKSLNADFLLLKLIGVNTRDEALKLKKHLYVYRQKLPKLEEGKYYIVDIIGKKVYFNEDFVAIVTDVYDNKANDIIVCRGEKNFSFPFLDSVIKDVLPDKIVLDAEKISRVAVFD